MLQADDQAAPDVLAATPCPPLTSHRARCRAPPGGLGLLAERRDSRDGPGARSARRVWTPLQPRGRRARDQRHSSLGLVAGVDEPAQFRSFFLLQLRLMVIVGNP